MEILSERIRQILDEKHMTQRQLAKKSRISAISINKYINEDKVPNIDTLLNISNALEVTPNYLLGYSDLVLTNEMVLRTASGEDMANFMWNLTKKKCDFCTFYVPGSNETCFKDCELGFARWLKQVAEKDVSV